jgi:protein-ribulosamine 3-kinase
LSLTQGLSIILVETVCKELNCLPIGKLCSVAGGCINQTYALSTNKGQFFIKFNQNINSGMFAAEKFSLDLLSSTETIRVPKPLFTSILKPYGIIMAMEFIPLHAATVNTYSLLGTALANLHKNTTSSQFGFEVNNTLGSTPQINTWQNNWVEFFRENRLKFQIQLAANTFQHQQLNAQGQKLLKVVDFFFKDLDTVMPSLLHGDLWSGNLAADHNGCPVIFDPASYYGHSEMELSIMNMFGPVPHEFYQKYHKILPRTPEFNTRQLLYKLYHYLNHLNLFGTSYIDPCLSIIETLLTKANKL